MERHTDAEKETHLLQMVSNWGELKTRTLNQENLKSVTTILIHMTDMESFGLMRQFIETLGDIFVAELKRCPETFFCLAKMKLHFNQFTAVYEMIKNVGGEMQGQGETLIQLWNATLYKEAEMVRGKELNSLKKFRLRSRKPPPVHICPNGARPTNSLPEHATRTLWRWALQHAYRLYPTKDERLCLEQNAGLTAYQVKTWFANVRRRIKKCGVRTIMEKKKAKYDITEDIILEEPPRRATEQPNYRPITPIDLVKGNKQLAESLFRADRSTRSLHATTPRLLSCTTPIWDSCPFNVDRTMQAPGGTEPETIADASKRYPSALPPHAESSSSFLASYNQHNNGRPASQRSNMCSTETPVPTLTGLTNVYHPTSLPDHYSCGVEELTSTFVRTVTPQLSEQLVPSTQPYTAFRQEPYPTYDICKWPATPGVNTDKSTFPDLPQCVPDRAPHELNTPRYVPDYHPMSHVNLNHSSYTPLEIHPIRPCYTTQTYKNPFPLPMMSQDPLATLLGSETPTYCVPSFSKDVYQGYYQSVPRPHSYPINSLCSSLGCNLSYSFSSSNINQNPSSNFLNLSHASSMLAGFAEPLSRPVSRAMCIAKQSPEKKTLVTGRVTSWSCEGEGTTGGLGCPPLVQPSLISETRTDLYGVSVTAGGEVELPATLKSSPHSVSSITRPGQYDMLRCMLQKGSAQYRPYTSTHHTNNTISSNTTNTNSRAQPMGTSPMSYIATTKSPLNYTKSPTAKKNRVTKMSRRQNQKENRGKCTSRSTTNGAISEVIAITSSPDTPHVPTTTGSSHSVEIVGMVSAGELLMAYTSEQCTNTTPSISSPPQVSSLSGYLQNPERLTSSVREQLMQATLLNEQFLHSQTLATREQQPLQTASAKELLLHSQPLTTSGREQLTQSPVHNEQLIDNSQTLTTPARDLIHPQTLSAPSRELLPHPPAEVLFTSASQCGRQVSERGGILHLSPEANRRVEGSAAKTPSFSTGPQQRSTECSLSADRPPPPAAALWPDLLNKDSLSGLSMSGHNTTSTAPPDGGSLWQAAPFSPRLPVKGPCAVVSAGGVPTLAASGWPCVPQVSTSLPLLPPTPQWMPASPTAIVGAFNPAKASRPTDDTRDGGVLGAVPSYPNLHLARPAHPIPRRHSLGSSSRSSLTSEPGSLSPYTQPDEQEVVEALLHLSNYSMPSLPESTFYTPHTVGPQYTT